MADLHAALATQLRNIEAKTGKSLADMRSVIASATVSVSCVASSTCTP